LLQPVIGLAGIYFHPVHGKEHGEQSRHRHGHHRHSAGPQRDAHPAGYVGGRLVDRRHVKIEGGVGLAPTSFIVSSRGNISPSFWYPLLIWNRHIQWTSRPYAITRD
jgi:hypothetical protein